ncbi:hypothetical protein PV797_12180 [Clostridiaceae bacterium M8S5]|nr:hypothetical protein PV797_12180 [Clostridiaceae bacterium M8S5]
MKKLINKKKSSLVYCYATCPCTCKVSWDAYETKAYNHNSLGYKPPMPYI